jgi:zinc-ribbon domain
MAEALERYCSACGQELRPEDLYCSHCGKPVHLAAHVPTPEADVPVPPPPEGGSTAPLANQAGASGTRDDGRPDQLSGQAPFSIKEVLVLGVGAGVFTLLTAPWADLPGSLFFAILAPMMGAVVSSIIKAYMSGAPVGGPRVVVLGMLTALWRFGALPRETKTSILLAILRRSAGVGLVSSVISVSTFFGAQSIIPGPTSPADGGSGGGLPPPTASPTATASSKATASPTATAAP